jgi:hypothetical protein
MASILLRVKNPKTYLESLIYVFQNQMILGHKILGLTIKYKNGERHWLRGNVDSIFKSSCLKNLEYGDLILLEHGTYYTQIISSDNELIELSKDWGSGCNFIIQNQNLTTYYIISDYPMNLYDVWGNEVISERVFARKARILNNICGRIHNYSGIITKQMI